MRRDRELNNVSESKNPPDKGSHDDSKKMPFGRIIRSEVQNLTRIFISLHDSNSIFLPARILSELVSARTLLFSVMLVGYCSQNKHSRKEGVVMMSRFSRFARTTDFFFLHELFHSCSHDSVALSMRAPEKE